MIRINNLFFIYLLVCLGYGFGCAYWDEKYSTYLFIGISTLVVASLVFSKKFYTLESHQFFLKQALMTTLITIFCSLTNSESLAFKVIDFSFHHAWIGAITFWVFTIFRRNDNHRENQNNQRNFNQNTGNTTLAG